jgi:hypothetical protein
MAAAGVEEASQNPPRTLSGRAAFSDQFAGQKRRKSTGNTFTTYTITKVILAYAP